MRFTLCTAVKQVPTDDRSNKDTKFAILYEDGSEEALSLLELLPLLAKPPEYFRPSDEPNVFGSRSRQCPRDIKMLAASSSAPVSEIPGSPGPSNSRYLEASSASSAATPSRVGTEARPLARADAERGAEVRRGVHRRALAVPHVWYIVATLEKSCREGSKRPTACRSNSRMEATVTCRGMTRGAGDGRSG